MLLELLDLDTRCEIAVVYVSGMRVSTQVVPALSIISLLIATACYWPKINTMVKNVLVLPVHRLCLMIK